MYVPKRHPSCPLPLKISKWVHPRILSNCYLSDDSRACEILCVPFKTRLLFLMTLWLSRTQSPTLAFKTRHSWGLSSHCGNPNQGNLMWGSNPLLFGGNFCSCDCPLILSVAYLESVSLYSISTPPPLFVISTF